VLNELMFGWFKIVCECQVCKELYILFEKLYKIYLPIFAKGGKVTLADCFEDFYKP
jgi:ubiquitin C-terminal hydrolase